MRETLYCCRNLLNGNEILDWAKSQGFTNCLHPDQMHATIVYSKRKFNWTEVEPKTNRLIIKGGKRSIEVFDKNAVVLQFQSNKLLKRWNFFRRIGASWDYDGYKSHITITYNGLPAGTNVDSIIPYSGDLVFGPEKMEKLNIGWKNTVVEVQTEDFVE